MAIGKGIGVWLDDWADSPDLELKTPYVRSQRMTEQIVEMELAVSKVMRLLDEETGWVS